MAQPTKTLTDLPPELLDHITSYLPTARAVSNLSSTSRSLNTFVEKDAWQTFARERFPSLYTHKNTVTGKDASRTLTTLSRAWDRRAFVARYTEPWGDITAFPGNKKVDRWKRPRGQTIGFTPQLDCFEEEGKQRRDVLAFSAGAEVCVRQTERHKDAADEDRVSWMTYRPLSAVEGRDDVTSLHLLRRQEGEGDDRKLQLITGTANGDLQLIGLSQGEDEEVSKSCFVTQGLPIRSSSLLQEAWRPPLLAASLDDTRVSLYNVDATHPKTEPSSQIEIRRPTNGHRTYRAWSTNFLSSSHLAVGLGPSEEPIYIHQLSESGLTKDPIRKYSLQNDLEKLEGEITLSGFAKKSTSSVYPIVPLPPLGTAASNDAQVFLSGAYDGIIRLHDLRSARDVEQAYVDRTDESAIYSLLPRGQEKLVAGTSRHNLLKVFDMRLGAKAYTYLDAQSGDNYGPEFSRRSSGPATNHWNLFLKPNSATYSGRGGGNNWARRSAESSIYSLASPSSMSPFVYAGVENAVVEMVFTSVADNTPDPRYFAPPAKGQAKKSAVRGFRDKEILDLAMYDQESGLKLMTQRSIWETQRAVRAAKSSQATESAEMLDGLDERWRSGGS
ncbi:uncharacterized protein LTR77_001124 [Saxophila tyrrhenica]|uniref:F-box domain-containing protein n=1 Tax=Saxophila tyrrhenica TaxID=1690608 RepID=A0AAV9PKK1_9PEZI|nr:hypothetical protein LTR77_001124 [Saxophila tyrrhenica]